MTMLNLRLGRQLQQEMTEMKTKFDEQKQLLKEHTRELTELKGHIQRVQHTTNHIEQHTAGGACSACEVITFAMYSKNKRDGTPMFSDSFYSHYQGYKFKMGIVLNPGWMMATVFLVEGSQLRLPVEITVRLELLNQTGDHHHVVTTKNYKDVNINNIQLLLQTPCHELEKKGDGISYVMDDCIKFRIHVTVL